MGKGVCFQLFYFVSRDFQQHFLDFRLKHFVEQINLVRQLKKLDALIKFKNSVNKKYYDLTIVFSDASRWKECGEFGFATGLLISELSKRLFYHTLS